MTRPAKSLTAPANLPTASPPWPATLPSGDHRVVVEGLERMGHDVGSLLAEVGLARTDLVDPDRRLPCGLAGEIIGRAQARRVTPNIGLALAQQTPLGAFPLIDYLIVSADTVGAGLQRLARYRRVIEGPGIVVVHEECDPIHIETPSASPFGVEYQIGLIVLHMAAETGGAFVPLQVSVRHRLDDPSAFGRVLGCVVREGDAWDGLTISRDVWALPMRRRDPMLRAFLEGQADDVIARLPSRTGLALDVHRALVATGGGGTRVASVARDLGMSERTLQRRLAQEGVSYQDLVDGVRKDAAARYLERSSLAIGEIAYLLGYSEPAAFHRAFKRWYDVTPETFRADHVS